MSYRLLTHASLSLLLTLTSGMPAFAEDAAPAKTIEDVNAKNDCYKKQVEACKSADRAASTELKNGFDKVLDKNKDETHTAIMQTSQTQAAGGTKFTAVAASCQKDADKCKDICAKESKEKKSQEPVNNCKDDFKKLTDIISAQATGMNAGSLEMASAGKQMQADGPGGTNATNTTAGDAKPAAKAEGGGGSGMGSMMSTMLPMAMIGAMMAMQAGKDDDKDQQQQQYALASNAALQANGTIDCSKSDAGYYADCNTYLTAACQQSMTNNTFSSSPTCTTFVGRYCGTSTGGMYSMPYAAVSSAPAIAGPATGVAGTTGAAVTTPTMGASGEGRATNFCTTALAYNYCQAGGRANCPSCQNLGTSTSAGCQQNPALCLGQTTQAVVIQARTSCPDDPIFANPAYSGMVASAPAVLPLPTVSTAVTGGSAPAILPASASGLQMASVGGRAVAATDTAGPTSDITGQYGPSVFSTSTQAISKLCQSGQLNCP